MRKYAGIENLFEFSLPIILKGLFPFLRNVENGMLYIVCVVCRILVRWMGVTNHGLVNDKGRSFPTLTV